MRSKELSQVEHPELPLARKADPVMWLANSRGYGLVVLKTEAERRAERALREERDKVRFLTELLQGKAAA